jgi:hypothetical protein
MVQPGEERQAGQDDAAADAEGEARPQVKGGEAQKMEEFTHRRLFS